MNTFRSILSSILCISLPIVSIGIANAGGDIEKPFEGSTNNNATKLGAITIEHSSAEKTLLNLFPYLPGCLPRKTL